MAQHVETREHRRINPDKKVNPRIRLRKTTCFAHVPCEGKSKTKWDQVCQGRTTMSDAKNKRLILGRRALGRYGSWPGERQK